VNVKRRGKTFTGFAHMPSNYSELQRLAHLRLSPMLASDEDLAPIHVLPDLVSLELDLTNSQQHPCSPPSAPSVLATTKLTSLSLNGKNLGFHGLHDRQVGHISYPASHSAGVDDMRLFRFTRDSLWQVNYGTVHAAVPYSDHKSEGSQTLRFISSSPCSSTLLCGIMQTQGTK